MEMHHGDIVAASSSAPSCRQRGKVHLSLSKNMNIERSWTGYKLGLFFYSVRKRYWSAIGALASITAAALGKQVNFSRKRTEPWCQNFFFGDKINIFNLLQLSSNCWSSFSVGTVSVLPQKLYLHNSCSNSFGLSGPLYININES